MTRHYNIKPKYYKAEYHLSGDLIDDWETLGIFIRWCLKGELEKGQRSHELLSRKFGYTINKKI